MVNGVLNECGIYDMENKRRDIWLIKEAQLRIASQICLY